MCPGLGLYQQLTRQMSLLVECPFEPCGGIVHGFSSSKDSTHSFSQDNAVFGL